MKQSERGMGSRVSKEIRKVMNDKVMWSFNSHFKEFSFVLSDMEGHEGVLIIRLMFEKKALQ